MSEQNYDLKTRVKDIIFSNIFPLSKLRGEMEMSDR